MIKYISIFLFVLGVHSPKENHELSLSIQNIEEVKGTIEVGVFDKADGFLEKGKAIKNYSIPVKEKTVTYTIKDLPEGEYAISLYQDVNSDGKCNRNFIGIPKEPYAFSTNFKPKFSAPKFKDCSFSLTKNKTLNIDLIN